MHAELRKHCPARRVQPGHGLPLKLWRKSLVASLRAGPHCGRRAGAMTARPPFCWRGLIPLVVFIGVWVWCFAAWGEIHVRLASETDQQRRSQHLA